MVRLKLFSCTFILSNIEPLVSYMISCQLVIFFYSGTVSNSPGLFCVHLVYLHFLYCYPVWCCSSLHKGINTRYMYLQWNDNLLLFSLAYWKQRLVWLVFFYHAISLWEGHNPANPNPEWIPSTQYNVTLPDPPTTNNFKLNLKIRGWGLALDKAISEKFPTHFT